MDERPPQTPPPEGPEWFSTKDRAKRFAFRLGEIGRERATHYAGERIGMRSFAEAVPALLAVEADMAATVEAVLARRLRDRERGETEIPFLAALEGVLERTTRARRLEEGRRAGRLPAAWAQKRFLSLVADAVARLDAFAAVFEAERILPVPAPVEVSRLLLHVEEDAALDRLPAVPTERPGLAGPPADRPAPALSTCAEPLEDLLRAARAEVEAAPPPWRVRRAAPTAPLVLSLGAGDADEDEAAAPPSLSPAGAAARTERAAAVLALAHAVRVRRTPGPDGATAGVHLTLADTTARAVGERLPAGAAIPPGAEPAVRAYVVAAARGGLPTDPERLVATLGLFRAVDAELERALGPALTSSAARVTALRVPREPSRKAPVHREVLATLSAAVAGFPEHRVSEVLDGVAEGKPPASAARPPDVAVVLAVLGRTWPGGKAFGQRVLPLGPWTDADVLAAVGEAVELGAIRAALDRGRDPGPAWTGRLEAAALGLLGRLARLAPPASSGAAQSAPDPAG